MAQGEDYAPGPNEPTHFELAYSVRVWAEHVSGAKRTDELASTFLEDAYLPCPSTLESKKSSSSTAPSDSSSASTTSKSRPSAAARQQSRSEEHTSELQSLMRISYAVFCLKTKKTQY